LEFIFEDVISRKGVVDTRAIVMEDETSSSSARSGGEEGV
jgi:hypothetical protein